MHQCRFVDTGSNIPHTYAVVHPSTKDLVPSWPYNSGHWLCVCLQCQQWSTSCSTPAQSYTFHMMGWSSYTLAYYKVESLECNLWLEFVLALFEVISVSSSTSSTNRSSGTAHSKSIHSISRELVPNQQTIFSATYPRTHCTALHSKSEQIIHTYCNSIYCSRPCRGLDSLQVTQLIWRGLCKCAGARPNKSYTFVLWRVIMFPTSCCCVPVSRLHIWTF